jgi:hypothetical protein
VTKTPFTVVVEGPDPKVTTAILKNLAAYLGGCGVAICLEDPDQLNVAYQDIGSLKDKVFITLRKK